MGNCVAKGSSADARARSALVDRELAEAAHELEDQVNLLLLGTGESGKSTIAKQMTLIHKGGFSQNEHRQFAQQARANLVANMQALLGGVEMLGEALDAKFLGYSSTVMDAASDGSSFSPEVANAVHELWNHCPAVQRAYEQRHRLQLPDSAAYFFKNITRVAGPSYSPTDEDILRVRVRTTAVTHTTFSYRGMQFRMVDVGGQRTERRRWIHCFQDATAIIFCVSLSEYNLMLAEQPTKNRMEESLELFEYIVSLPVFNELPIILFLNKTDLFREKIEAGVDLTQVFPDYTAGRNVDAAMQFVRDKFVARARRPVYFHFTCATNTQNVRHVFDDVRDIILTARMQASGF